MSKHKIIVVGGVPCVGKTSICGNLAREFDIDIMLSTDYLREFVRSVVTGDANYRVLDTSVYDAWNRFGARTRENIIKGYREQGVMISRGMNAVIERADKNGENMIIEALYFMPEKLPALSHPNVLSIYIQVSDPVTYRRMILERTDFTHPGQPGERLAQQSDAYRFMAEDALESCRTAGITVFDNLDYQKTRDEITRFVAARFGTGLKGSVRA